MLMGLSENLVIQPRKAEARSYLIVILQIFASRLAALKDIFPLSLEIHEKQKSSTEEQSFESILNSENYFDLGYVQPIRVSGKPFQSVPELVKDVKFQFKSILIGIKATVNAITAVNSNDSLKLDMINFTQESDILVRVFKDGLDCFEFYFVDPESKENSAGQKEDKEVVEAFASIFTSIDLAMFQETCCEQIGPLFNKIRSNPYVLAIPQSFLASRSLSPHFSGPLLKFLVENFDDIGGEDSVNATVMLRLFKLLFNALTLFPDENEYVFQPHLAKIIMSSIKTTAKDPLNYFLLLRGLFRSIGGGKFESLYQEVLPLLQVLLETLNNLLASCHKQQMRELFVELCLTVPVRLSVLLPHLSYLMRPLTIALQSGTDLVSQSLKTLELCIDNLNQEFLEPIFAPVIDDLMRALWSHLKPAPHNKQHSVTTLRILGKFGGRNRRLLRDFSALQYRKLPKESLRISMELHGSEHLHSLPLDNAIKTASQILTSQSTQHHTHAFEFLKSCAPLLFESEICDNELKVGIHGIVKRFKTESDGSEFPFVSEQMEDSSDPFPMKPEISMDDVKAMENILCDWMNALFFSSTSAITGEAGWELIESIVRHFVILSIDEMVNHTRPEKGQIRQSYDLLTYYSSSKLNGLMKALVNAFSSDKPALHDVAEKAFLYFYECCVGLLGSEAEAEKLVFFRLLAIAFEAQCYQPEWFKKSGGCRGLSLLSSDKVKFSLSWLLDHELEFTKALLYVLKDTSIEVPYFEASSATHTLKELLRACNGNLDMEVSLQAAKFNSLVVVLISELSNANGIVRSTVQSSLELLADITGKSITDLISPVKDKLLYPIFAKPLRALPFAMQIGYIDAITYCLTLQPCLVSFSEELGRLLQEALALADSEDQTVSAKDNQFKNAAALNNLRVECIKLLSAVISIPEMSTPKLSQTRSRIIQLFFKSLYSKSPEVIAAANIGLTEVLGREQRLPKDLLQVGLKPILVNLSDYSKLSVAGLQGLSRLLELLTHYFKVEIGKKLLDHLRKWAEPTILKDLSSRSLLDSERVQVIVAILDVFYLLPPAANIFMDDLVLQVMELEILIRRSKSSPFRKPLIRFLNRYSSEAVDYFFGKFDQGPFAQLFLELIEVDIASPLRDCLMKEVGKFEDRFLKLSARDSASHTMIFYCIELFDSLSRLEAKWLLDHPDLLKTMRNIWTTNGRVLNDPQQDSSMNLKILNILMRFLRLNVQNIDLLFETVRGFSHPTLIDANELRQFIFSSIKEFPVALCSQALSAFLGMIINPEIDTLEKLNIARFIIIPMLMFQTDKDLETIFDASRVKKMIDLIWSQPVEFDGGKQDALRMELLQLTTLIIYRVPIVLNDYLKEIIKFGWSHLKSEDIVLKQAASVLLCRFIKENETPVKIVTQTFVSQLRANQLEIRPMVKQALDSLIPALPSHSGMNSSENNGMPTWVGWICRTIIEDGHSVGQMVSIYQLIIRNELTMYENRNHLIPQIVSSLSRLGLSGNATAETKALSIDLAELLLKWEEREISEIKSSGMDVEEPGKTSGPDREQVMAFLIRFSLTQQESNDKTIISKSLRVFKNLLNLWPHTNLALAQTCKAASLDINENLKLVQNSAQIIDITLQSKSDEWIVENFGIFQGCLDNWTNSDNSILLDAFSSVLKRVYSAHDAIRKE
jgi:transformation/transcription domain-associated protein